MVSALRRRALALQSVARGAGACANATTCPLLPPPGEGASPNPKPDPNQADFHAAYLQLAELIHAKDFGASPVPRMRLVSRGSPTCQLVANMSP